MPNIRDVLNEGGIMPEPKGDSETHVGKTRDPIDDIEQAVYRGEKLKRFKQAAGIKDDDEKKQVSSEELQRILEDAVNKKIAPIEQAIAKMGENKERQEFYHNVVDEVKNLVASSAQGKEDPITTYEKVGGVLTNLASDMKSKLGIEHQVNSTDIPGLLQLEDKREEREDRQRQHAREMKESDRRWEDEKITRQHQWEMEQKRWEAEFGLKVAEFNDSKKAKEKAGDSLGDLVASMIGSIDVQRGAGKQVPVGTQAPELQVRIPKTFRCRTCGTIVEVSREQAIALSQSGEPIPCPNCGASFDFRGKTNEPTNDTTPL